MKWTDIQNKLRTPQKEALKIIDKYFKSKEKGTCLIHMPTGSGKSGIISVISNIQFKKSILVVTPRIALTDQIQKNVTYKFWKDVLQLDENPNSKKFQALKSDAQFSNQNDYDDYIFFSTIQKVDWIRKNKAELYDRLKQIINLVIFDEGHYEPAYSWSKTVRQLECKSILFTATPYRNDLKPFNINDKFIYIYKYEQGLNEKYLRSVEFKSEPRDKTDDIFLNKVLSYYKEKFGDFSDDSPKLIIRCSQRVTIRRLTKAITKKYKDINIIAIHETFSSNDNVYLNAVPKDDNKRDAKIWLHQNKLLEGIDDSNFKMLAIYDDFKNDRGLIQQIGRLVRIGKDEQQSVAYVIDFSGGRHEEIWNKYLAYDSQLDPKSFKPLSQKVLDVIYSIGGEYEYLLDGYKKKFDFNSNEIPEDIKIPCRVNFLNKSKKFELQKFIDFLEERLRKNDNEILYKQFTIEKLHVNIFLCLNVSTSPFLEDYYAINVGHELIVFIEFENLLAYYDSMGYLPVGEKEYGLGKSVDYKKMGKVLADEKGAILRNIGLQNSNIGNNNIRSKRFSANSIEDTVAFLDDRSNMVTTASGFFISKEYQALETEDNVRNESVAKVISRYLGVKNGRISESGSWVTLNEYVVWVKEIHAIINDKTAKPTKTLGRYANPVRDVNNPIPKHILLDIEDISNEFVSNSERTINGGILRKGEPLHLMDVSSEVEPVDGRENEYSFTISVSDNITITMLLKYDLKSSSFQVVGDELNDLFESLNNIQHNSITEFLNKRQSFKIIPEEQGFIYAYGAFYKVHNVYGKGFSEEKFQLKDVLIDLKILDEIESEKGDKTLNDGDTWDSSCLFGLLDKWENTCLEEYIINPELVVFDDMGTEIADVIYGYESKKRIIFVHAKCGNGGKYSATALQDVCSQATKNVKYLNSYNSLPEKRYVKWNSRWKANNLVVNRRIRKPEGVKGKEMMQRLDTIIQNPTSDKEVWLVLGNTLSRSALIEALKKGKPEAIQSTLLLHSTLQTIGTVGAKLRVFCSP